MKKLFYSLASLAVMASAGSCQQELDIAKDGDTPVTLTVKIPEGIETKAIADGENVNILHYEVYGEKFDKCLAKSSVETMPQVKHFTLTLDLVADQTYNFLFWAEVKGEGHYNTADLRKVKINDYSNEKSNDETRAAFFAKKEYTVTGPIKEDIYLYRPFAQLNFGTKDYHTDLNGNGPLAVESSEVTVTNIADTFNTLTGKGEGTVAPVTFEAQSIPSDPAKLEVVIDGQERLYEYLSMNYLIVNGNSDNVEVAATFVTNYGDVNVSVSNVPIKENYRTNIVGDLLTVDAEFEIIVDERFIDSETEILNPDINVKYWDGATVEVVKPVGNVYTVTNGAQLAWISQESNKVVDFNNNPFNGAVIDIKADIHLNGKEFTPIYFYTHEDKLVTVNGNGHVISDYVINGGENLGLFSDVRGNIKDLHVKNVTIKGTNRAGAVVGRLAGNMTGCSASNVDIDLTCEKNSDGVYEDAAKAGALVGYVLEGSYTISSCHVENSEIYGYRDLGACIGYTSATLNFADNSAKNVNILADCYVHEPYEQNKDKNVNTFVGNRPDLTGVAENVKIKYVYEDKIEEK